jgi:hypothetical protein
LLAAIDEADRSHWRPRSAQWSREMFFGANSVRRGTWGSRSKGRAASDPISVFAVFLYNRSRPSGRLYGSVTSAFRCPDKEHERRKWALSRPRRLTTAYGSLRKVCPAKED